MDDDAAACVVVRRYSGKGRSQVGITGDSLLIICTLESDFQAVDSRGSVLCVVTHPSCKNEGLPTLTSFF
jgi:hypothetical protein